MEERAKERRYLKNISGNHPQMIINVPGKAFISKLSMKVSKRKNVIVIVIRERIANFVPNFFIVCTPISPAKKKSPKPKDI